ncbi:ATP-binding protein [Sphingopyxis sp. XHP0097]|jgi:two-component system phosphate regulon sensor histidine kinase PhoR|uniref:histidine kinase n=2 Tax=Sphingomonadaceae TaxID=41297 RepID=A0ABS7MC53_9SPHN|nr:ATP-binding protein [Sphingopyxis lutea]MBL0767737.1 two-component sensor histidine kinase [Sphingopyxis lutea]MBY4636599.1 ATP-binding protein [Sphingopyxis jiangsuensis]
MFDRLSSLVAALTMIAIAALFAAMVGGDALSITILTITAIAAVAVLYSTLAAPVSDARVQVNTEPVVLPPRSLLHHPDFAQWADQEKEPLLGTAANIVTIANDAAIKLLGRHIVGADIRTAIRHPAATDWLSRLADAAPVETLSLADFPRPGQRWTMRIAKLSGTDRIIFLSDRSAIDAADRMRSDFVANASHELRTPLAAILGYVETLQDMNGEDDGPTRHRFLSIIDREARRMQQLVMDLLSISRVEADRFRRPTATIDLRVVAGATVAQLRESDQPRARDIVAELGDAEQPIFGDEAQLSQLAHNIITNAMKYGRPGTPVTVKLAREGTRVRLSVVDEGDGIEADHIPRLTERFYRVDEARSRSVGGTGLGLAIVKHISERHQGQLDIASEIGKGTTVSVVFRLATEN